MSDVVEGLRAYQQGDADGVMVLVSRQACDEGAAEIETLRTQLAHWKTFAIHAESEHAAWKNTAREVDEELRALRGTAPFTDTARSALLWVLWHHQGGSSPVGQPLRFALGMDAHQRLTDAQVQEAKQWATDMKMEMWGVYHAGMKHARDAQRHMITHHFFG